jgi:class 3 adenylate cyclase/TolB-like protein
MKRRLAAILVADVAGYSSLMAADEEGTAARMSACRALADAEIAKTEGRLFKAMGDSVLVEFASPMNALRCAVGIRDALVAAEQGHDRPLTMRFGLHLADVLVEGDDLIGDGVNLAARIQQAADPGAIDLSASIFEQVRRTSPFAFEDRGEQSLKNIGEPVRIYRLRGEMRRHPHQITHTQAAPRPPKRPHSLAVMPFEVPAADNDQRFLSEGLAEELILELGRFRKLFVTSRLATRALEGMQDPQCVGERLGVRYVLTGTVRQLGSCVRLTLTLTETETGTVVWSDRLSRPLDELIDHLDEVVSRIASTVLDRIQESDIVAARRMKPESMTAYEFYLRGLEHHRLGSVTDDNVRMAMGWFKRAIEADPGFARPYAMLTCSWSNLPDFNLAEGTRKALAMSSALWSSTPTSRRPTGSWARSRWAPTSSTSRAAITRRRWRSARATPTSRPAPRLSTISPASRSGRWSCSLRPRTSTPSCRSGASRSGSPRSTPSAASTTRSRPAARCRSRRGVPGSTAPPPASRSAISPAPADRRRGPGSRAGSDDRLRRADGMLPRPDSEAAADRPARRSGSGAPRGEGTLTVSVVAP